MNSEQQPAPSTNKPKTSLPKILFQIIFSLIVLGCAVVLASHYIKTPPKAKPRTRTPIAPLVTVASIQPQNILYEFEAMGTVTSAKEIQLTPRVNGDITGISPEMAPGGYVKKGDHLVTIDPTDYELTILQLQSDLAKATSDLKLEMGSQRIAIKEFEILGQEVSDTEKTLMLREPQLGIAKATVASAEAKLKRAKIDLSRTKMTAPFNGVILSKSVDLGSHVSTSTPIARLVGTDQFWVKVNVPTSQLQWLDIPDNTSEPGSPARVFMQDNNQNTQHREGRVIRLSADLEAEGRMAVLYVSVDDPLSLSPENSKDPKLLLGSFVRVSFTGRELDNVYAINRNHLRENNTIWLLTRDNTLEIKQVDIIARTKEFIYTATTLNDHPRLITSQIPSPKAGTPLRLLEKGVQKTRLEKQSE
ncbi:MAG: RND family efflux transporter MFP subunit [Desulforhopalus sp.]|jgi:RND family efflux transporter MFP subunit